MISEAKREYNRAWGKRNKEWRRRYGKMFYYKNREKLLAWNRKWSMTPEQIAKRRARYRVNRERILAQKRESYNPESKREYNRQYALKNAVSIRKQQREYRKTHKDQILERNRKYYNANPGKHLVWQKRWNSKNRHLLSNYDAARRARELKAVTNREECDKFYSWVRNQDFVSCTYCGRFVVGKSAHIDHIVPLSRGGHHVPDNFAVSCCSCNSSKSDYLLSEWRKCPEKLKPLISN